MNLITGGLNFLSNIPILGQMFKPLTDILSAIFGGQQGADNVQSAMDDYSNGTLGAEQLFNTVDSNFDGSKTDGGGPIDQLKDFLTAQKRNNGQVDGDRLMGLLNGLQGNNKGPADLAAAAQAMGAGTVTPRRIQY